MLLADAENGKKYKILKIFSGNELKKRIYDLGITPSCIFTMLNNTMTGPVLVHVRGTRIALGRKMCKKIEVLKVD